MTSSIEILKKNREISSVSDVVWGTLSVEFPKLGGNHLPSPTSCEAIEQMVSDANSAGISVKSFLVRSELSDSDQGRLLTAAKTLGHRVDDKDFFGPLGD